MAELAMSTQSLGFPRGRMSVAWLTWSQGMGADPGLDCSHLCHNTLCCNPDHLVLELRSINNDRNHCKNEMHCFGHGSHTKCLI